MNKKEKEQKVISLEELYEMSEMESAVNTENLLLNPELLKDPQNAITLSDVDYNKEMEEVLDDSTKVVGNMASLYFDDNENILSNKYIKDKIRTDAQNLSDLVFLQKMAKKTIIKQMEQVEDAEGSPRLYETMFQGMREIREIIKQSTTMTSTMQTFYKDLFNDLKEKNSAELNIEEKKEEANIMTASDLNNKLDEIMKKNKTK